MNKVDSDDVEDTKDEEETNHQGKPDDNLDNIFDDDTKIDLVDIFPNTDDNPVEYIYTENASTGKVIAVESRFMVPRDPIEFVYYTYAKRVVLLVQNVASRPRYQKTKTLLSNLLLSFPMTINEYNVTEVVLS